MGTSAAVETEKLSHHSFCFSEFSQLNHKGNQSDSQSYFSQLYLLLENEFVGLERDPTYCRCVFLFFFVFMCSTPWH